MAPHWLTAIAVLLAVLLGIAVSSSLMAYALGRFARWSGRAAIFGASCLLPAAFAAYTYFALQEALNIADGDPTAGMVELAFVVVPVLFFSSLAFLVVWEFFKKQRQ
jgi:hypothetical protein